MESVFFVKIGKGIKVIFLEFFWDRGLTSQCEKHRKAFCNSAMPQGIAILHPFPRRKGSRTKIAWERYGKKPSALQKCFLMFVAKSCNVLSCMSCEGYHTSTPCLQMSFDVLLAVSQSGSLICQNSETDTNPGDKDRPARKPRKEARTRTLILI